jgi:CO/xanthine dehydrogenase Mo-binding subunit
VKPAQDTAVHGSGTLVNPRSLAGHITGGTVQGIGTALHEEYVYGAEGGPPHAELPGLPDPDGDGGA